MPVNGNYASAAILVNEIDNLGSDTRCVPLWSLHTRLEHVRATRRARLRSRFAASIYRELRHEHAWARLKPKPREMRRVIKKPRIGF